MKKLLYLLSTICVTFFLASCAMVEDFLSSFIPTEQESNYLYTDFSNSEKALFTLYVGEVLPFPATNEYGFEGYYEESDYENGIHFYAIGNTYKDFSAYRDLYSEYDFVESRPGEHENVWYRYQKNDILVDMSYYFFENTSWIDVYVCSLSINNSDSNGSDNNSNDNDSSDSNSSDNDSSDSNSSDNDSSDSEDDNWNDDWGGGNENIQILDNDGKGLPTGTNGVYAVDFTKAKYAKDVTDQGYYLGGCPTTGSPSVLVIPIEFSNLTASSRGFTIDKIERAFNGGSGTTDYYSVHDYYYTSSYGKLDLNITVWDSWFKPKYDSNYYKNRKADGELIGDQMIMDEALEYLSRFLDLSEFDSDKNGFIDSVVLITTLNINSNNDFQWAFRYWNSYVDNDGYYYEYDGVCANDYLWASYQFLYEGVDKNGNTVFTDTSALNTYTFIHEFGHVLGATDYYDVAYIDPPMDGYDIMDVLPGDHNAYTKFNYGWLTSSRLVVAEDTLTLSLEDFSQNGDTIIIANNWDKNLGVYQEYYILVYYRNTGLNGGDFGYFENNGILVYHVNASLYKEVYEGETYYDVYNTNTDPSHSYGTEDNLIEFVLSKKGNYVYSVGDGISANTTDDQGNRISYTFTVDSLDTTTAQITFKKNN